MSKKNKKTNDSLETSLDMSKGFGSNAFANLKALQDKHKADAQDREAEERRRAAERERVERMAREAAARETRELRFTEHDLMDSSQMTDEEIFEESMRAMDGGRFDLYQSKFNTKELPKQTAKDREEPEQPLTMTDEEREFAIFTQEMAMSNVQRLVTPRKPVHKVRNKRKYEESSEETISDVIASESIPEVSPVSVSLKPSVQVADMRTDFVSPNVAVTQIQKGEDVLERPDMLDAMTSAQYKLIKDIRHYESKYGMLITLRLRGLTLNAAMSRLNEFIDACVRERKPYALIICGKGLNSAERPVIKEGTLDLLRNDKRVVEYAPALNGDGDFGSIYAAFRMKK